MHNAILHLLHWSSSPGLLLPNIRTESRGERKLVVASRRGGGPLPISLAEHRRRFGKVGPSSGSGAYDSTKFEYETETDEVICPQGKRLRFEGKRKKGPQRPAVRSYRCQHYQQCPVRERCSRRRDGRRIEVSPQRAAVTRQREKRRHPAQQALMRQRKAILEPVFATIKQALLQGQACSSLQGDGKPSPYESGPGDTRCCRGRLALAFKGTASRPPTREASQR
jgi:hypothetical protein